MSYFLSGCQQLELTAENFLAHFPAAAWAHRRQH
jgi:hypothetical protein